MGDWIIDKYPKKFSVNADRLGLSTYSFDWNLILHLHKTLFYIYTKFYFAFTHNAFRHIVDGDCGHRDNWLAFVSLNLNVVS